MSSKKERANYICKDLRIAREAAGLTVQQLSDGAKVSRTKITQLEKGDLKNGGKATAAICNRIFNHLQRVGQLRDVPREDFVVEVKS